ncbi:WxL protein peptidoglycan domain-containing protein, partial [Enterococcus faecalis]|uniref:WxL protein peptidoglycan domain-containing protein n=1 Tax=Enterococcus faecalis TaxID=1351 RepID=UPI003CC5AA58
SAQTNYNGVIVYKGKKERKDSSLAYDLKELITGDQTLKLNGNEKKEVPYTITKPEQKFEGILLGGFHIHKKDKEKFTNKKFQIKKDYTY